MLVTTKRRETKETRNIAGFENPAMQHSQPWKDECKLSSKRFPGSERELVILKKLSTGGKAKNWTRVASMAVSASVAEIHAGTST